MRELEQLQQYELILTVRSPLFVGSGQSYQRTEYIYNRRSNRVSVLHRNRFIRFLAENDLADSYERFILGGSTNLHSFLRQECGLDEAGIRALCVYDLPAGDALDAEHSLKNIQAFMRDNAFRPYVPGSSVKGALRTVLLYQAMQEQGILGTRNWRDYSKEDGIPEREYLNTLRFVRDSKGKTRLDAVSSLLRGVLVSDSEPIPQQRHDADRKERRGIRRRGQCHQSVPRGSGSGNKDPLFSDAGSIRPAWTADGRVHCGRHRGV